MTPLLTAAISARFKFLTLSLACVLLAIGSAIHAGHSIDPILAGLVLLAALSAHASVNLFNEYSDFKSGLDFKTVKTPYSGGTGNLPAHPYLANRVLFLAIFTLLLTIVIGLYLVWLRGWLLLIPGITGVVIILAYTGWINRWPWICLLAPGLAFGPIMVIGSEIALSGQATVISALASLVPFFVVNNLLLLNQVPDIEADKSVGRRHIAIAYGFNTAFNLFRQFNLTAATVIISAVLLGYFPVIALVALLPLVINGGPTTLDSLPEKMKKNVIAANAAPALLGLSLMLQV